MIHVKFMGHIKSSMGREELDIPGSNVSIAEMFAILRDSSPTVPIAHGFTEFNTLVVVNDQEAHSASSRRDMLLRDGDSVLLVPFSHGG